MASVSDTAYVIHTYPFQDAKIILEILTATHGKISVVMRKSGKRFIAPQSFVPHTVSWRGNTNLKTLDFIDTTSRPYRLSGVGLYCAIYCNELIQKLVSSDESLSDLYAIYENSLRQLVSVVELNAGQSFLFEPILREFEIGLLCELGYGFDFGFDASGLELENSEEAWYHYNPDEGFIRVSTSIDVTNPKKRYSVLTGQQLRLIACNNYESAETRRQAKFLTRQIINRLLNGREIKARELFSVQ